MPSVVLGWSGRPRCRKMANADHYFRKPAPFVES
jgi:hypothetical protein